MKVKCLLDSVGCFCEDENTLKRGFAYSQTMLVFHKISSQSKSMFAIPALTGWRQKDQNHFGYLGSSRSTWTSKTLSEKSKK